MSNIVYEILETLIVFPENGDYHKELNLIKWGNNAPKYDLRSWTSDHGKMSKGITLTKDELILLKEELGGIDL